MAHGTNEFNFGDDSDHRPDPGVRSPKSGFTGLSIMLAFGEGLRSLSTYSIVLVSLLVNYHSVLAFCSRLSWLSVNVLNHYYDCNKS